jgi:putative transposase
MRRLLTGYAQQFNRRHNRAGHLFQNRYKSFLCEEEPYLLELLRYIHLNPMRAGAANDMSALGKVPWCSHGVIMGKNKQDWQDSAFVLRLFHEQQAPARKAYAAFVEKGIEATEFFVGLFSTSQARGKRVLLREAAMRS